MRDKYLALLGGELLWLPNQDKIRIYEWTLKGTASGCLLVAKGYGDGAHWVAFAGGRSPEKCLDLFMGKLRDGTVVWQPDKYRSTMGGN